MSIYRFCEADVEQAEVDLRLYASKAYVDATLAKPVRVSDTKMSGVLEINSFKIKGLPEVPQHQQDARSPAFTSALMDFQVRQMVAKAGDNMTGDIDMGGTQRVISLTDPVSSQDSATESDVNTVRVKQMIINMG